MQFLEAKPTLKMDDEVGWRDVSTKVPESLLNTAKASEPTEIKLKQVTPRQEPRIQLRKVSNVLVPLEPPRNLPIPDQKRNVILRFPIHRLNPDLDVESNQSGSKDVETRTLSMGASSSAIQIYAQKTKFCESQSQSSINPFLRNESEERSKTSKFLTIEQPKKMEKSIAKAAHENLNQIKIVKRANLNLSHVQALLAQPLQERNDS